MVRLRPGSSSTKRMREFILILRGNGRQGYNKRGAGAQFAFEADASPVRLYNFFHQMQSEAGAVHLLLHGLAAAEECVEYVLLFVRRYPRAMVRHANLNLRAGAARDPVRGNPQRVSPCPSVLDGVGQQVLQRV